MGCCLWKWKEVIVSQQHYSWVAQQCTVERLLSCGLGWSGEWVPRNLFVCFLCPVQLLSSRFIYMGIENVKVVLQYSSSPSGLLVLLLSTDEFIDHTAPLMSGMRMNWTVFMRLQLDINLSLQLAIYRFLGEVQLIRIEIVAWIGIKRERGIKVDRLHRFGWMSLFLLRAQDLIILFLVLKLKKLKF